MFSLLMCLSEGVSGRKEKASFKKADDYLTVLLSFIIPDCRWALVGVSSDIKISRTSSTTGIQFSISPRAIKKIVLNFPSKVSPTGRVNIITNSPLACIKKSIKL